jgi:hypothetical protein
MVRVIWLRNIFPPGKLCIKARGNSHVSKHWGYDLVTRMHRKTWILNSSGQSGGGIMARQQAGLRPRKAGSLTKSISKTSSLPLSGIPLQFEPPTLPFPISILI